MVYKDFKFMKHTDKHIKILLCNCYTEMIKKIIRKIALENLYKYQNQITQAGKAYANKIAPDQTGAAWWGTICLHSDQSSYLFAFFLGNIWHEETSSYECTAKPLVWLGWSPGISEF